MTTAEGLRDLVHRRMDRHRWIMCAEVAAGLTAEVEAMQRRGAPRPLLLVGGMGTGDTPNPEYCELVVLGTSGATMMEGIRAYHSALRDLPSEALRAIEKWDPHGEAEVLGTFLDTEFEIAGRPSWGVRPESWLALEDKTTVAELWDAASVEHSPFEVVPAARDALVAAATRLAGPEGTVWAGDNREGWHGGAEYTRYVPNPETSETTMEFMETHCDRVRVMPFLQGVPCSIHGLVFPDSVAVFRPVEMLVFRSPGSDRFTYASAATSWDPPPPIRESMRSAARGVGEVLRAEAGFRGSFTVDGVVTPDGWLPTELNPRFGAGLSALGRSTGIPMLDVGRLLVAGEGEGIRADELETLVVAESDSRRWLAGFTVIPTRFEESEQVPAHWEGATVTPVEAEGNALLIRGPASAGGLVRFSLLPDAVPSGVQAAPIVAAGFAAIDRLWGAGIGELVPGRL